MRRDLAFTAAGPLPPRFVGDTFFLTLFVRFTAKPDSPDVAAQACLNGRHAHGSAWTCDGSKNMATQSSGHDAPFLPVNLYRFCQL
jgi:hypothetical protein